MSETVTLASCAFLGIRKNRDPEAYCRLLLNDLAKKKGGARLVVATNDTSGFEPAKVVTLITGIEPYLRSLWDVEDPEEFAGHK